VKVITTPVMTFLTVRYGRIRTRIQLASA
jgi:hypothetical protein